MTHPWFRPLIEVHKDETPCPANDPKDPQPCPRIGTGAHESVEQHLLRAHGTLQKTIDSWGTPVRVADGSVVLMPDETHQALMENIHEMMHGRTAPNDLPEAEGVGE